jgi:hypothetical protein
LVQTTPIGALGFPVELHGEEAKADAGVRDAKKVVRNLLEDLTVVLSPFIPG